MRKALLLGGGLVILLFAALVACSDGLSTGADNPLADKGEWVVYGYTFLENTNPPPYWVAHGTNVGLRSAVFPPGCYIDTKISDEQTGYYSFPLEELNYGNYAVDGWYANATTEWWGSTSFTWDSTESPVCNILFT